MAKASKPKETKPKKRGKKDITVKTNLTADQLFQLALKTPPKTNQKK